MRMSNASRCGLVVVLSVFLAGVVGAWLGGTEPQEKAEPKQEKPAEPKHDPVAKAAEELYAGVRMETLDNGLRVFLKPIPDAPVVTTMVAYKVGSADEELDQTGLSHYLEHLMFKGTDKIMPGDIDRLTLRNGGANNAYTSEDCTVYHFNFASDRWEAALEVEADRMRNLRIDAKHEFEQEKGAVIEELGRNEDEPWDLEYKTMLPLLFGKTAPYGHPVIGERDHVRGATAEVIKAHYDKWYAPNNAILVICGGFDPDKALAKIKQQFGPIPAKKLPERKPEVSAERKEPVRHEIASKFEIPRMLMGFNTVRTGDPDYYALEVLQAILSDGKTSRLYKKLVEKEEIAVSVDSANSTGRYPGWLMVQLELLPDKDRKKAEEMILAELKRLCDEPVTDAELKRVRRSLLASAIYERESTHGLADSIARGVTIKDFDYVKSYLPKVAAVTAKDVQEAARKYLDPQKRVVVWSVPGEKQGSGVRGQGSETNFGLQSPASSLRPAVARHQRDAGQKEGGAAGGSPLANAQRVVLDNGLTLLLLENRRLPIVVANAYVRNVRLLEPEAKAGLNALMGRLLEEGTAKHSGPEIAEMIENVGGELSMHSSGGGVKVLAPDRSLGLELLFECLMQPSFPQQPFARERQRLLSEIDDAERQPDTKAQTAYRALVYGKHPFGRPNQGWRKTVEPLTRGDCADFHRLLFVPNNTVVAVVGDFDSKQVIEDVKRLTAEWKKAELPKIETPKVEKPKDFTQQIVSMPQAAQLHFYLGHVGVTRDNPDYYKLLVMDYILGTGPGFTDRLSSRLRDREGLAYTVSGNISSSATEEPGTFTCYIGTDVHNFDKVKKMILEEVNRIRDEKAKEEEVEDAKKYLLGSIPFQFATNERLAAQMLYAERYKLGFGYLDDYRKAVGAVTADDVQAAARKYLDPQRSILAAAGALDQEGKPLAKTPEK